MATANEQATAERLVDATGPYVTRCGGMVAIENVDLEDDGDDYPADSADDCWGLDGSFLDPGEDHPLDLVAKADVDTLIRACVRNLLALQGEADASDERIAFLTKGLVAEYTTRLAEWVDHVGVANAESEAERAVRMAGRENGGDEEEPAESGDLITGPGEYVCANGMIAVVEACDPTGFSARPWIGHVVGDPGGEDRKRWWASDGTRQHGLGFVEELRIVRKCDPTPTVEPATEPEADASETTTCKVRAIAISAEFDGADADLILPGLFEAFEGFGD